MLKKLRYQTAILVCSFLTISGLATGVIAQCDGNSCQTQIWGCTPLHSPFQDNCCIPSGSGSHCETCWRDLYWCSNSLVNGSAYNCSGAGAVCS